MTADVHRSHFTVRVCQKQPRPSRCVCVCGQKAGSVPLEAAQILLHVGALLHAARRGRGQPAVLLIGCRVSLHEVVIVRLALVKPLLFSLSLRCLGQTTKDEAGIKCQRTSALSIS